MGEEKSNILCPIKILDDACIDEFEENVKGDSEEILEQTGAKFQVGISMR